MVLPVGDDKTANTLPTPPVQPDGQGVNGQGYVTREELAQFQEGLKEILANNYRATQSQTDRYQARVQQSLSEFQHGIDALRAGGVELTDAQVEGARNKLVLETLTKAEETPQQPQQPQPQQQAEEADPYLEAYQNTVTAAADRLQKIAGVEILDDDPEVSIIEQKASGSVEDFLDAVSQAIEAKRARIAKGPPVGQMPSLTHGGAPASNDIQNIMDPTALWEEAVRQGRIK